MSLPAGVSTTAAAVERGWGKLWPQLTLREGFWLAYLFGSDLNVIRELTQRAENYARMQVGRTEIRWVAEPDELTAALEWLLSGHGCGHVDLTLAWIVGVGSERGRWLSAWTAFLRRLNERRDLLRRALPAGVALVLPGGTLDAARDAAPDLWSYRSAMIELGSSAPAAAGVAAPRVEVTRSDPHAVAERAMLPAVEPSPTVRGSLQEAAQALRAGQIAVAVDAGRAALDAAHHTGTDADPALAHAWLARALEAKNDGAGALDHAHRALGIGQPIGVQLTRQLLTVLATSPEPDTVLVAHRIAVDLDRLLIDAAGESVESLRDLSVSLNNVARINQLQGQLNDALTAYTESLTLRRRIRDRYGDTPESLRDLSISLNNVARINQLQGQLNDALTAYTEAIGWYEQLDSRFGPPLSNADELTALRDARQRVAAALHTPGGGDSLGRTAALFRRLIRRRRRT